MFLTSLGEQCPTYADYLRSEHWRAMRERVLAERPACEGVACGRRAEPSFHVHHLDYTRVGHEEMCDLLLLCPDCHDEAHGKHMVDTTGFVHISDLLERWEHSVRDEP